MFIKEDALLGKGIAMLLMVTHHMMGSGLPNMDPLMNVMLLGEINSLGVFVARFSKICVIIFTLLSGYGLCSSIAKADRRMENGAILL